MDEKTNYINATKKHVEQDQTIDERTYSQLQKEVNAHSIMWTEFLKIGEHTGNNNHQRARENMISSDRTDPPLSTASGKTINVSATKKKGLLQDQSVAPQRHTMVNSHTSLALY